jgi:hypothetical protein
LRLQPALGHVRIQEGLRHIETGAKADDNKCHNGQVPESQARPHAGEQRNMEMMLLLERLFHGLPLLWWRLQAVANAANRGQQFACERIVNFSP